MKTQQLICKKDGFPCYSICTKIYLMIIIISMEKDDSSISSKEMPLKNKQVEDSSDSSEEILSKMKQVEDFENQAIYLKVCEKRSEAGSDKIEINYPYTFIELADQLYDLVPPPLDKIAYMDHELSPTIEDQLEKLQDLGFDIYFKDDCPHNQKNRYSRRFLRKLHIRYECDNPSCPHINKQKVTHKWKSAWGLIFFTFKFVDVVSKHNKSNKKYSSQYDSDQSEKYPYVLHYNVRLYDQECQFCKELMRGEISKHQAIVASQLLCFMVVKILQTELDPVVRPKRHRHADDSETGDDVDVPHRTKNCEACFDGVCKYIKHRKFKNS